MTTTTITWSWGAREVVAFDPSGGVLDFGWIGAEYFTLSEVDGSVVIDIPTNTHSYTLQGVALADLSLANIAARNANAFAEWSEALGAAAVASGGTVFDVAWNYGTQSVLEFDPAKDRLDFGWMGAQYFSVTEVNGSVVIFIPENLQSYTLNGVTLEELSASNILATDSTAFTEFAAAIAAADAGDTPVAVGSSDGAGTTTSLAWAYGTNTVLAFDPAKDTLDFGWIGADYFTVAEANGSVVIFLPENRQTYTLAGVSLAELTTANIVAADASALAEWSTLVAAPAPEPEPEPEDLGDSDAGTPAESGGTTGGSDPDGTGSAAVSAAWSADVIYWGGDRASVGNVVYEAKWWTLGTDPEAANGPAGSGNVWTVVGYADTTPVAPEAPEDLAALTVSDTSVVLMWDAAEVKGVGTVSGYAVYLDGELVGTTSSRSFKVAGLAPDTDYSFTVVAIDEAGTSGFATPVAVTTEPAGSGGSDGQVFSPYMNMWSADAHNLVQTVDDAGLSAVTLAFVIGTGEGEIGWAGLGSLDDDTLSDGTSIASMVDQLHAKGVAVTISFGGGLGQEPALYYSDAGELAAAYQSVIDKYGVTSLDFDLEADALTDDAASALRNAALVTLEEDNPDLSISFTLPVLPTGLTQDGLDLLAEAHAAGVDIDTVNIMVMNYGEYHDSGDMGDDAIAATEATIAQLEALGIDAKVGITPQIGENDIAGEVFTLEDAQQLTDYADGNDHVAYLAMWALSRDHAGDASAEVPGSGITQHEYDFSKIFATV
ncbi:fibronectin type III domain-containing protein [Xanthobacter sp. KR7-225]|uniref:fibronectin type III domain-containing protein n=1 Tax=Xanthobacter sp. KR7-225 TaxID=3156613 RepID=UPI0032B314AA